VNRLVCAISVVAMALLPLTAGAAPSPSPSPSLDQLLLAPPAGYAPLVNNAYPLRGKFTATQYASHYGEQAVQVEHALTVDGFVDAFGKTWWQKSTKRVLVESVIAFSGGAGARSWLASQQAIDQAKKSYKRANPLPGIDPYYGGHYIASTMLSDVFVFVKGNDMFTVGFYSPKNDVLALANTQTKAQYDAAPSSTIPTDQWPENAPKPGGLVPTPSVSLPNLSGVLPYVLAVVLVLGVLALGAGLFLRRGKWKGAPKSMAAQLSPDGTHWWDGRAWHDSAREVPPFAQRSGDGGYWWDGHAWRPVPAAPQAATIQ